MEHASTHALLTSLVVLFWLGFVLFLYYISFPFFVKKAVGFHEDTRISLSRIKGQFWYVMRVFGLLILVFVVPYFAGQSLIDPTEQTNLITLEIYSFITMVFFGSVWVCALTLMFKWMVDGASAAVIEDSEGVGD